MSKANNWGYNEDITKSYLRLKQTKVLRRKIEYFSYLSYDFWFQSSRGVYVKFAEKLWIFLLFVALQFVVGYWGRIWGTELPCGRVEWKSAAIFDWSGLLSLSGPQGFCGDTILVLFSFSIWQCAWRQDIEFVYRWSRGVSGGVVTSRWFGCIEGFSWLGVRWGY